MIDIYIKSKFENEMFDDYGDRYIVLNNCQSDCRKSLLSANQIIRKIFPTANWRVEIERPRANCLMLMDKNLLSQVLFQASYYMIVYSGN